MQSRTPAELATIALEVASQAALLLQAGFRSRPAVGKKARIDLVTEFDLASEVLLRQRLSELTPELPLIGEEQGGTPTTELAWYVDPLDGTTNFVHGHPFYCVSVGAMRDGRPVAGAVVAPSLGLSYHGAIGELAYRNGEPCRVSDSVELEDSLLATGFSPNYRREPPHDNFEPFLRAKRIVRGVRRCGAAALDLCFVADGTYDGYWERSLHAWDLVAGSAILLAAGGRITGLHGREPELSIGHVIASNGRLHEALLELVGEDPQRVPLPSA